VRPFFSGGGIFRIGGENFRRTNDEFIRHGDEDFVFLGGCEAGERAGGLARAAADDVDFLLECHMAGFGV
jgi:hypothetical protein